MDDSHVQRAPARALEPCHIVRPVGTSLRNALPESDGAVPENDVD